MIHKATGIVERTKSKTETRIAEIKEKTQAINQPLLDQIKNQKAQIYEFMEAEKDHLFKGKKRSREFTNAKIGYQKSSELKTLKGAKWSDVLAKLKSLKLRDAISRKEEPDKDAIKKLSAEKMKEIGVELKDKDTPYIDLVEVFPDPAA
jgi:phage host-nuclease inhibitor protein Gam